MILNLEKNPDIIIVDDHLIFRQGLKAIINFENIGTVIGEASNGEEFIEMILKLKPDLVLMDIDMPNMNGIEATDKALKMLPDLKIIAFTVFGEEESYRKMFEIGARGYLLKSDGFNELEKAISLVLKGEKYSSMNLDRDFKSEFQIKNIPETDREADSKTKLKGKMQFFPWVVKKNKCVNSN